MRVFFASVTSVFPEHIRHTMQINVIAPKDKRANDDCASKKNKNDERQKTERYASSIFFGFCKSNNFCFSHVLNLNSANEVLFFLCIFFRTLDRYQPSFSKD